MDISLVECLDKYRIIKYRLQGIQTVLLFESIGYYCSVRPRVPAVLSPATSYSNL